VAAYGVFFYFALYLMFGTRKSNVVLAGSGSDIPVVTGLGATSTALSNIQSTLDASTLTLVPTGTPVLVFSTPTNTPIPSTVAAPGLSTPSVNTNASLMRQFYLSFYDPHIGVYFPDKASTNCLEFDFEVGDCVSKVNHGQDDYRLWIGKGAACPVELPYDTVFYVHQPVELKGIWRCIDTGALNVGIYSYIDFMLTYPDMIWTGPDLDEFPWSSLVTIEILSTP
jgi:hypothetical protein